VSNADVLLPKRLLPNEAPYGSSPAAVNDEPPVKADPPRTLAEQRAFEAWFVEELKRTFDAREVPAGGGS
jgi:hypothetical protein